MLTQVLDMVTGDIKVQYKKNWIRNINAKLESAGETNDYYSWCEYKWLGCGIHYAYNEQKLEAATVEIPFIKIQLTW